MRLYRIFPLLMALALPLTAHAAELTVSAAVTLSEALKVMAPRFEAAHPGTMLRFNLGASGVLLQQIERGAPVDVLVSADQDTLAQGVASGRIDGTTRRTVATNAVVLIVPAEDGQQITALPDLTAPGIRRIALGKPDRAPAGRYASRTLQDLQLWSALEPRLVMADTVRQVLDYVARGEVDAGFVHRTDAALMPDKVKVMLTLEGGPLPPYPAAVVTDSREPTLARAFVAFLASPYAQEVLAAHGFGKP